MLTKRVANLFRSIEGVVGQLIVTDLFLRFDPREITFQNQPLVLPLWEIENIETSKTLRFIPNGLSVWTRSSLELRFVVWKSPEIAEVLEKAVSEAMRRRSAEVDSRRSSVR